MSETSIEWTHPPGFRGATWNPVVGCRRVSPGCEHCYAETMAGRLARMGQRRYLDVAKRDEKGQPRGRWNGTFREVPEALELPLRTRKPTCYFVNSMSDLFGEGVSDEYIEAIFGVMAACPQHRFQVLTKRAERMARWFSAPRSEESVIFAAAGVFDSMGYWQTQTWERALDRARWGFDEDAPDPWPLPNVHIGVSVEDQQRADERIGHLFSTPAAVRFLSVEPLLGPVDLSRYLRPAGRALHWLIVGGESGPGARPCDLAWIRSIVAQCKASGTPAFCKQLGAAPVDGGQPVRFRDRKGGDPSEWPEDLRVRQWQEGI